MFIVFNFKIVFVSFIDYSNNSISSLQNRLIKVKEEMKAKSKLILQNDIAKTEMAKKLPVSESKQQHKFIILIS